ncbi:hypothetical protein [Chryseobacterium sp.]|uniref:hypothetical protein n=1 Tax=Chryseobacterium sp. TaxID=1871047 RepID=UPI0025C2A7FF|nr:hypothetical protein [Chryseobacterium sp.]
MKYFIILFSALTLVACKKENPANTNPIVGDCLSIAQDSIHTTAGTINIGTIAFPKETKECSCYFAKNKADFEAEKYIYADDAGKTAYMQLDGQKLVMNLLSSSDMEADEELSKEIENDDYKISVKAKKIKGEEALLFQGSMTIEKSTGETVTLPIYGECGC